MDLYIKGKPAFKGMVVTTSDGKVGELKDWFEPHKSSSSGKVYVKFPDRGYSSQFYASVIGGKFLTVKELLYEEIGKEFQEFDFKTDKPLKQPKEWDVTREASREVEHMEIEFIDEDKDLPDCLENLNMFVYVKKETVVTRFLFIRK